MAENLSLDRQISDIICRFCRTVKRRNQKGLYDLTRSGEDVVCHLLNLAFGWNLINLNREYPNCPVIDLADRERNICVQVTAAHKSGKINSTAERLEQYHGRKYNRLLLFYLLGKPATSFPAAIKDCRIEVLDMEDLITALSQASQENRRAALKFLYELEDGGFLEELPDLATPDQYFIPSRTLSDDIPYESALFICQRERVRLTAFLPRKPEDQLCCRIEFARRDTSGSNITFDQETILECLFHGHHESLEKRGFSAAVDCSKDFAALQLGNTRYFTDIDTAQQLCSILDDLQEEYDIGQKKLAKMLGTDQFIYPPEKDWSQPICRLPGWLWEALWTYAQRHDINCSNGEWTLFDGHTSPGTIRLLRRPGETISNGIVMELQAKGTENSKTVYWHRGMIWSLADWEGFTDDEKWRADQSLDWLLDHWLPRLSEELYSSWRPWGVLTWLGHKIGRIPHKKEFIANIRSQVESFKK